MKGDLSWKYATYCRPKMGALMQAVRLDKQYHAAKMDRMYYDNEKGEEIEVLDFLGGYGSTLFGHNHPALVSVVRENYEKNLPFACQASCRSEAALLCEKLSEMMFSRTRRNFVITLGNSGAEAVEAAVKHAEFAHHAKRQRLNKDLR